MKRSNFLKSLAGLMIAPKAIMDVSNKPKFEEEKPIKLQRPKQQENKTIKVSIYGIN
ncbi:MAG: hypothetical protein ACYCZW_03865 [Minisyncoccota bacterium]